MELMVFTEGSSRLSYVGKTWLRGDRQLHMQVPGSPVPRNQGTQSRDAAAQGGAWACARGPHSRERAAWACAEADREALGAAGQGKQEAVRALLAKDWEVKQPQAAWTSPGRHLRSSPRSQPGREAGGGRQSGVCPRPACSAADGEGASTWLSGESQSGGVRRRSGGCPGRAALGGIQTRSKRDAVLRAGGSSPGCCGPRGAHMPEAAMACCTVRLCTGHSLRRWAGASQDRSSLAVSGQAQRSVEPKTPASLKVRERRAQGLSIDL